MSSFSAKEAVGYITAEVEMSGLALQIGVQFGNYSKSLDDGNQVGDESKGRSLLQITIIWGAS